jgi:hypothetical protein
VGPRLGAPEAVEVQDVGDWFRITRRWAQHMVGRFAENGAVTVRFGKPLVLPG